MTSKNTKKTILFAQLAAIIATILVGVYQYNRKPQGVENEDATDVTAARLTADYLENEKAANEKYLNKVLLVKGIAQEVTENADSQQVVLLDGNDPLSGVQCTMQKSQQKVTQGDELSVKGKCTGYTIVVVMSGCIIP